MNSEKKSVSNSAKFTFFYLLSLGSLISGSIALGNIIFQLIDKNIPDVLYQFYYDSSGLKFAIASLIVSAPIYFFITNQINKNLSSGDLTDNSFVRRWLSYLILLITSMIEVGWLIALIYSLLEGDMTLRFFLKSLTALSIAGLIFSYYFFDIKKEKDFKERKFYFQGVLILVIGSLIAGIFFVESPIEARKRKLDNLILSDFNAIDSALNIYYTNNKKLPNQLDELINEATYLTPSNILDKVKNEKFDYKVLEEDKYELCADFNGSNKDLRDYLEDSWRHESGHQCFKRKIRKDIGSPVDPKILN